MCQIEKCESEADCLKFSGPLSDKFGVGMKLKISLFFMFLVGAIPSAFAATVCMDGSLHCTTGDNTFGSGIGSWPSSGAATSPTDSAKSRAPTPAPTPSPKAGRGGNTDKSTRGGGGGNTDRNTGGAGRGSDNNNADIASGDNTDNNGGGGSFDSCAAQAQSLINDCTAKREATAAQCNTEGSSSLSSAMGTASKLTTAMSSSAPSANGACSSMGMLGASAQAALAAYQVNCSRSKNSCMDVCESAKNSMAQCARQSGMELSALQLTEGYREASANYRKCSAQQEKVNQAGTAVSNIMSETAKAKECQEQLKAMNTPSNDPNSAYCRAHPTVASCFLDCNHPNMAGNQTCICLKNPMDPSCGGMKASESIANSFDSQGGGSPATNNKADLNIGGAESFDPDTLNAVGTEARRAMAGQAAEENGGKLGGSASLSSGLADGNVRSGGGGGGFPADINGRAVNSGFYASGSGSGGWSGGNSNNGGGNSGGHTAGTNGRALNGQGPDLRQFLPGGQMDPSRRGIAGINGTDGISGPIETNWAKMQRRYRYLESTFLP